jgi:hypothetical protein
MCGTLSGILHRAAGLQIKDLHVETSSNEGMHTTERLEISIMDYWDGLIVDQLRLSCKVSQQ